MHKNNIPIKVAIGYCVVAVIMISAISLVYVNTKSIIAINEASKEYLEKKNTADSTMSALLKEERQNLRQLSDAMAGKPDKNYLQDKVKSLNTGKDSVMVHPKAPQTHEAKSTTVEVVKTRKGFFRRLADAFKKEHAETLSVKRDSNMAVVDTVVTPVNVAENVADILQQIEKSEKTESRNRAANVSKEIENLKMVSAQLALRSANQLNDVHQKERDSMRQAINKAMDARRDLLWQMGLLALVTLLAIVVLVALVWRDSKKERVYRENLEAANEEIQRVMSQRERLLTITHDIKAASRFHLWFHRLDERLRQQPERHGVSQSHQELCHPSVSSRGHAARLSPVGERPHEGKPHYVLAGSIGDRIGGRHEAER